MDKETKKKIAYSAANVWCRCFKCDGIINESTAKCRKPNTTCWKWHDGYKTALIALDHIKNGEEKLNYEL